MADVILDVGFFNVKDELVFVDEVYFPGLEEEVIETTEGDCNYVNTFQSVDNGDKYVCDSEQNPCKVEANEVDDTTIKEECVDTSESSDSCREASISSESISPDGLDVYASETKLEESGKRLWACDQCERTFISRKGSMVHRRTHTGERPFTCDVCYKRFIDNSTLVKHRVIHQAVRPFTCSVCGRGFNQKVALQRHESTHSLQTLYSSKFSSKSFQKTVEVRENTNSKKHKLFACIYCPSKFNTLMLQKQHERVHTNERPFACDSCPKAFKDSGTLFKHQKIHLDVKPFICPICSSGFTQKVALRKHIRSHVFKTNLKGCLICKCNIVDSEELYLHLESHALENYNVNIKNPMVSKSKLSDNIKLEEKQPNCEVKMEETHSNQRIAESDFSDLATLCDVAISTSRDYLPNKLDPHRRQLSCFYCGMQYKQEHTLHAHLTGVHLFCLLCHTKFFEKSIFQSHQCEGKRAFKESVLSQTCRRGKSQPASRQFSCEMCGKSFNSRNGFVIHQRSHTGERPFPCRWCHKAFGDSATRRKHERIHTGERPFKCLSCPRAFNQKAALRAHQIIHSCDRAFSCQYCPSSFPYMTTLLRHISTFHTDVVDMICPICSKSCGGSDVLSDHIRSSHVNGQRHTCCLCDSGVFTNDGEFCDHLMWHAKQQVLVTFMKNKKEKQIGKIVMMKTKKQPFGERKYSID